MNFDELKQLKEMGVRRVRYADGTEVEFGDMLLVGSLPKQEQPDTGTAPIEQMPSRAELRELASRLAPPEVASE